jgi:hypothetical protein
MSERGRKQTTELLYEAMPFLPMACGRPNVSLFVRRTFVTSYSVLKCTVRVEMLTTSPPKLSTWLTYIQMPNSPRKELSISSRNIIKNLSRCVVAVPELINTDRMLV